MGRISATLKPTTESMAKAYAEHFELTFSQGIQLLSAVALNTWWQSLDEATKKIYKKKYKIGGKK